MGPERACSVSEFCYIAALDTGTMFPGARLKGEANPHDERKTKGNVCLKNVQSWYPPSLPPKLTC
jgi:hypothetical protein